MEKKKISFFFLLIFLLPCLLAKNLSPFFVSGVYPSDSILVAENKPVRLSPWDTITVVFNRPVIRLGENWETEVTNGSVPFSFVGAVIPGRIRWVTTYMARFDTFSPWASDLDFYLTINQDLTTFDGQRIRFDDHHPLRYHFATYTLTMSISTVTSKTAVELTSNLWNAFLAARTSPQKDGQSAEWIQGTPEVPADGFVELSFSSRVEVPLIKKALQILPAPVPSYQISECENRYGFQVQELEGGTNCIRIHFDEQLSPGFLYNFFLPKGTVYDHLSGPLASSITLPFSGPFLFIVPFYEHQVNSNGQSNEPYIENGPLPSPSDVSSSKGRRKKSPFPFYGHPSSLNWKIYLRHGLSKDTSTQQLKDCIQVFQKNSTSSEPLAIPFDILFSSPATLTIRGDYSPLTQYIVSFGKSPACVAVDGYGLPAKYSSISFETSPLQSFTCYGNDVENPIFDSSDISAKPLSWTYLSRTLERNQQNCVVSENTEDILAHAAPVTLSSLPSVLCSLHSRDRNTFPTPTQTLRTSLSSSVIQSQFDTESLLTPSGLFFHWENRYCVISFRGTVSTNDLHAVTFSLGVSPSSLKVKYAVWALSSTSLTPVVGAEVHIYIGSKDCGSASQVRKVTSMTIPDAGVVFFELESLSYPMTYHAVLEYQGRLQYLGELFPISHYDGNPASAVIFTDRKLYRPGDTMYVKGYVRHLSQYPIQLTTHDKYAVSVAWKDGGEETSYPVKLNQEYGSFNLTIEIPRNGEYTTGVSYGPRYCSFIRTSTDYPLYITSFDVFIGDPRPPTVLLSFQTDDEIIRPEDEGVQLNLATSSYLGLPVANADVEIHWIVIRSPISFFGPFGFYGTASTHPSQLHPPEQVISTRQSEEYGTVNVVTDTNGKFSYKLVPKLSHPLMGGDSLAVSARWISPTGEMISSSLSVKVRNSDIQIYLTPSYYPVVPQIPFAVYTDVRKSEGWEKVAGYDVTLSLVQWDGVTPIISGSSGKIEIMDTSSNLEKTFKEWKPEILNTCSLLVQIQEANACLFTLPSLGRYLIIAETKDSHNQPVRTFYPVGLNESEWNEKRFKGIEQITLRPDRDVSRDEKYSFGDVAKITYFCPYPLAKALVVFGHQSDLSEPYTEGILDMEISDGPGLQTIDIPIDSRCIEKCTVTLALFRPRGPLSSSPFSVPTSILFDPSAAAFQTASLVLSVQSQQWMTIEILPSSLRVKPGENTSVDVVVRDKYTLAPVKNAEVCVFSVNRAYIDPLPPAHFQSLSLSALSYSPDVQQMAYSTYDRLASLSGYEKSLNILLEILRVDPWSLPYWTLLSHSYMRALVDSDIEEIIQMRSDSLSLFPFYRHGGGIMYDKTPNPASLDNGQNLESFSPTSSLSDTSSSSSSSTTSPTPLELRKNFVITQLASLHAKTDAHGRASLEYTASDYIGSYTFAAFSAANDGVRFGQYPDLPSLPSLTQLVLPSSASLTPLLPRQLHLGDLAEIGVLVTLFPSSPSSSQTRKFWVVLELECDQIVADSNYEMSFEMKDGDAPREVLFSVVAVGIGKTKIQVVLWEITESGSMVSLDGFEEYVRVSGCCDEIQISSSVFLRSPSTDVPLQYEEGLQIPSAVPHTGYLINTIGVGFYPAVRTFAFSTFPSGLSDERDRYTYHLLSKLTPWPALSRYEQAQHPSFQFAKEEHFRSLVLLAAATYPTYGLQYSLNTMYPSYNLELNALGIFLNQRAVAIVGKEAGAPTFLLQIWNKALIASLYSLVSIKGRNPKDFCEQISFAYLALGRSWKPEEQYSDFLSLASLDKVILTCSPTARSYRALVDIDANQQTPLLTSLLDSLESAIRVGGRFGYVGQNRWVDVTGSAIALETLSRGNRFSREMTGMLASFVGQTVDETPDYIAIALRYGFGDQQIAYSLLALSSFDFLSDSSRPNLMFQISCERSILLSGAFKGDISNAKAMSSFTPFDSLPTPSLSTWINGTGTVNVRSTLSFVPSRPSEKMEDFGIRVEKIIQMLNHTTRMPDGPSVTQFRKGDIVVVTIQISVPDEYTNVRVRDPLPGGLEGLDDRLNNGANMNSPGEGYMQYYFHEREFYPGSVEFQAYYLPAGVYSISYQAIAVTAGKYLLPSTKAWLLRTPEVFGISLAGEVTVFGNQPLSTSSSADTPYQKHCLPSSPTSYYRGAYFDPVPLGGYPQIWDPTISPVSLPSELVSLRMIGVFVFVCLGVALVVGLLWLRRPRHSGYSKFPQIEIDSVGSEDQDNEGLLQNNNN